MPYHHGTCGCFEDTSVCCDTLFCPCCQMGRQCSALEGNADTHNCGMCVVALCVGGCFPMCLRCKVSDKFQLEESCCASFICGWLFPACSVCMTGRELNFRGVNPGGCCCKPEDAKNM